MRFAARLACEKGLSSQDFADAQASLLDDLGLPPLAWHAPAADLLSAMKRDKKARAGEVRFVLASDVGNWSIVVLPDAEILSALAE